MKTVAKNSALPVAGVIPRYLFITLLLFLAPWILKAQEASYENIEKHIYTLAADSMMGRSAGSVYSDAAANYIAGEFANIGIAPFGDDGYFERFSIDGYSISSGGPGFKNVVGVIEGSHPELRNEFIVIGAHYDHIGAQLKEGETIIYNGADDNASGVSALIEAARIFKSRESELQRSIILIAFDAEEWGLYGSKHFVSEPPVPLSDIKLMISLDMVGWYAESGKLYLYGTKTIKDSENFLSRIPNTHGISVEAKKFETNFFTGTDTEPFAEMKIPTIHATTGAVSPYHKPEDTPDKIDYQGVVMATDYIVSFGMEVSRWEDYKESGKISRKHRTGQPRVEFGPTVNTGSVSHYYTSGSLTGKSGFAVGAGLTAQVNMGIFGLRPEVFYEYMSTPHPAGRLYTHGLTVPFSLVLQTPYLKGFGANISLGGYYTYRFDGRQAGHHADFTGTYYRNEAGAQFGVGMRVANIGIAFTGRYALTDMLRKNVPGPNFQNRSAFFTLTYYF